jgi:hypothetical protein
MRDFKKQFPKDSVSQSISGLARAWAGFCCAVWLGISLLGGSLQAQVSVQDSTIGLFTLDLRYQGFVLGGPISERWGFTSTAGVEIGRKFENNLFLTTGVSTVFCDAVDVNSVLNPLLVDGFLLTDNGLLTEVRARGQGMVIPLKVGYIFGGPRPNPNSGFFVSLGGQYLRYRFNLQPFEEEVAGLSNDYLKGYDQLASGFGAIESIGYRFFSNRGMANFTAGLTFSQNFTRYRRAVHFATGNTSQATRVDLMYGFFAAWTYPLYNRAPNRVYYY